MRFLVLLACLFGAVAGAVPLQTYDTYVAAYPSQSRKGQFIQLLARGTGTNDMYVMEVDPTTGALPVSATITFNYDTNYGAVGADTLRTAAQIGNATGAADFNSGNYSAQTLRVVVAANQPAIPVSGAVTLSYDTDYGAVGASTLRTAAQVGNATGAAAFGTGTRSAQTLRVTVATDDVVPVSQSGTWNINDISGTISLPTGASTAAKQDTGNTSLSSIDGKLANDYGLSSGAVRTASQIGNASGAAAFGTGTRSAQTLRVTVATDDVVPASQSGTWNINNISGTVSLPTGASTEATLSTLNGKVANDYGVASGAVRTASQIGNASGVASFGTGAAGAQTLRVVNASDSPAGGGRAYSDSSYMSYSSSNVTTGAWVQIDASTAGTFNEMYIFSSCGETIELGTGSAASETRVLLIPPGGIDGVVNLAIPSGTRLSLKGVSGNCTSGQISLTGLN